MPWAWSSSVVLTHAQLKKLSCGKDRSDLDGKPIFKLGGTLSWLYSLGFKSRLNKIVLAIPNLSLPGFYFHWSFHPHMPLFNKLLHLLEGWTCAFLWMPASQPASQPLEACLMSTKRVVPLWVQILLLVFPFFLIHQNRMFMPLPIFPCLRYYGRLWASSL